MRLPYPASVSAGRVNEAGFMAQDEGLIWPLKPPQQNTPACPHGRRSTSRQDAKRVKDLREQRRIVAGQFGQALHRAGLHNGTFVFEIFPQRFCCPPGLRRAQREPGNDQGEIPAELVVFRIRQQAEQRILPWRSERRPMAGSSLQSIGGTIGNSGSWSQRHSIRRPAFSAAQGSELPLRERGPPQIGSSVEHRPNRLASWHWMSFRGYFLTRDGRSSASLPRRVPRRAGSLSPASAPSASGKKISPGRRTSGR